MNREAEEVMLTEVVTRDGFQNEPGFIETETKVDLIRELIGAGVRRFEVASFVSPKRVPQMRDADEVFRRLGRDSRVSFCALVLNRKGVERALKAGADEINFVFSLSETHNRKNSGRSLSESLELASSLSGELRGITAFNVAIATGFGCPYEGVFDADSLLRVMDVLVNRGVSSFVIADTTGMAHPKQVKETCKKVLKEWPELRLQLHLHNTRGMGAANVVAGLEAGVRWFDTALSGIGGCPFAPGATGNVCTEDIAHMLEMMGYTTGIDLDALIRISRQLERRLGRELPGQVMKAGKSTDLHPVAAEGRES